MPEIKIKKIAEKKRTVLAKKVSQKISTGKKAKKTAVSGGKKTRKVSLKKAEFFSGGSFERNRAGAFFRAPFINPEELVSSLGIKEGEKVADLGVGTGYFVFPIAKRIGDRGTLFAVDVVSEKLESVESQSKIFGFSNIITKRGDLEERKGSGLLDEEVDWVFLVNVLFQNKEKSSIAAETFRVLKKGGKAVVIEWKEKETFLGPAASLRISRDNIENIFNKAGFQMEKEIDAGAFHCGFIFVKK